MINKTNNSFIIIDSFIHHRDIFLSKKRNFFFLFRHHKSLSFFFLHFLYFLYFLYFLNFLLSYFFTWLSFNGPPILLHFLNTGVKYLHVLFVAVGEQVGGRQAGRQGEGGLGGQNLRFQRSWIHSGLGVEEWGKRGLNRDSLKIRQVFLCLVGFLFYFVQGFLFIIIQFII